MNLNKTSGITLLNTGRDGGNRDYESVDVVAGRSGGMLMHATQ